MALIADTVPGMTALEGVEGGHDVLPLEVGLDFCLVLDFVPEPGIRLLSFPSYDT